MDQINVQRWASSLRHFQRNDLQPSIVTDVVVGGSSNGVRNVSTIREYELTNDNPKSSFTSREKRYFMSNETNSLSKSQFHTFDKSRKDDETLYSVSTTPHSNNPSFDLDTLSDAGTYIIEDDISEEKINYSPSASSALKQYSNRAKHRHGTFDIHGLIASAAHTIHRPVVDANIPQEDLLSSSTDSSLLSFNEDEEIKLSTHEQCSTSSKSSRIKPAESFVISPILETKSFSRRKLQTSTKPSPATPIRSHTNIHEPTSSFQRQTSSLSTTLSLTKTYGNTSQHRSTVITHSGSQTNRAVELRRARAHAKIEELAQRTKKQLYKPNQHTDMTSGSWHTSTHKKDSIHLRPRIKSIPQKEDFSTTRTISSTSPNSVEQIHAIEEERRNSLRDNGERLTIKLIQLSSRILEKLKPNDLISVHELEQLVKQLQTIKRTLTSIDAVLTGPNNDETFV